MTTIITALFPDAASARRTVDRLTLKGFPARAIDVIASTEETARKLERAGVHESAIEPYAAGIAQGQAALVVRATYKPLGAARLTRETLAQRDTVAVEGVVQEHVVKDDPYKKTSVLLDHPRFLTAAAEIRARTESGPVTAGLWPTLKAHKARRSVMQPPRRVSRAFWPMPLVTRGRRSRSAIHGGRHMSRLFWPMPLLSKRPRGKTVIPGGGFPMSRLLGWPTVT